MCRIVGILDTRGRGEISRDLVARMNERQHHRGPDEGATHFEPGLGLGHRRLSIIDLATGHAAAVQRGRLGRHRVQRRDLQRPGTGARARSAGPPLPHQERHRGHRPRLGELGRGLRQADAPLDIDPNLSLGEAIADDHADMPEDVLHHAEIEHHMHDWLEQLTDKQRWVIERRFGINNNDIATLEDLAADLKVTRERVRQIQMEALRVLRQMLRRKGVSKDQLF